MGTATDEVKTTNLKRIESESDRNGIAIYCEIVKQESEPASINVSRGEPLPIPNVNAVVCTECEQQDDITWTISYHCEMGNEVDDA